MQFGASIVIARLLTPDEVGVFALAMAANFLIASLREFGIGSYLIRQPNLDSHHIRTSFAIWIVLSWTIGTVLLITRVGIARLYDNVGIAEVLLLVAGGFFVTPLGQPAQALLQRELKFHILHHIALASALISASTSIYLAYDGHSYMSLAWGMFAGTVCRAIFLIVAKPDHLFMIPSLRYWRDLLKFGGWMSVSSILGTVNSEGTKLLLGGWLGPASVALYDRASQLPYYAREAFLAPIGRVLLPAFSKLVREEAPLTPSVIKLISFTTIIIWPSFFCLSIVSEDVVVFLFGNNWRLAGEILPYILLSQGIFVSIPHPNHILVPYGRVRLLAALSLFAAVIGLLATVTGAMHSLELFAQLRPIAAIIIVVAWALMIQRYTQINIVALLRIYAQAIGIAVLVGFPIALIKFNIDGDLSFAYLATIAIVTPFLWWGTIWITKHPINDEILTLKNRIIK